MLCASEDCSKSDAPNSSGTQSAVDNSIPCVGPPANQKAHDADPTVRPGWLRSRVYALGSSPNTSRPGHMLGRGGRAPALVPVVWGSA
jgi:hypothetical protein